MCENGSSGFQGFSRSDVCTADPWGSAIDFVEPNRAHMTRIELTAPAERRNDEGDANSPSWLCRDVLSWPALIVAAIFVAIYGTAAGRGFISDDYAWIRHGHFDGFGDIARVFASSVGFYRPLVSLSFGINYELFGMSPRGYGLTNLTLAVACAIGVIGMAREMRLPPRAAVTAAALWLFNFHGINFGVLWLSGRTSLLLTMFSLLAAVAFLRGRTWVATTAALAAMLSKEEAVLLPLLFSGWAFLLRRRRNAGARWWGSVTPMWLALSLYLVLRVSADAMWPGSAPAYYEPTLSASRVARNIVEYADRSMTFSLLAVVLTWVSVRRRSGLLRVNPEIIHLSLVWFVCAFAITVFLPVRSSLYAVFPSVAVTVVAAACIEGTLVGESSLRRRQIGWAAVCLLVLLTPVYWFRNVRWTSLAELSSAVVAQLMTAEPHLPDGLTVTIEDDESSRVNLSNAWAGLAPEMAHLTFGGRLNVRVVQREDLEPPAAGEIAVRLVDGQLIGLPER
jgi:hypothetical protein